MGSKARCAAALSFTLCLVLPASASASTRWEPNAELSPPGADALFPRVAVDADGDAVAVWWQGSFPSRRIHAAVRPAGGGWSTGAPISDTDAVLADVDVDADGNAVAVWRNNNTRVIEAAFRPAGGDFGAAQPLSEPGQEVNEPDVEMAADGAAVVAWSRRPPGLNATWIEAAYKPADGSFAPALVTDSGVPQFTRVQAAVDGQGGAIVTWRGLSGSDTAIYASDGSTGGWGAPVAISPAAPSAESDHDVAVNDAGDAVAAWGANVSGSFRHIAVAVRHRGGSFGAPTLLGDLESRRPRVAITANRDVLATWMGRTSRGQIVQAASRRAGSDGFGAPVTLSHGSNTGDHALSVNERGNAVVAWQNHTGPANTLVSAAATPAGETFAQGFCDPETVSEQAGGEPDVAVDTGGHAVAAWRGFDGSNHRALAAGRTAGPPRCPGDPPQTTIDSGPSGTVYGREATLTFSADVQDVTFECRLDGADFAPCASPVTLRELSDGSHTFEVRATDTAGKTDRSPAERTFTVQGCDLLLLDLRPHGIPQVICL